MLGHRIEDESGQAPDAQSMPATPSSGHASCDTGVRRTVAGRMMRQLEIELADECLERGAQARDDLIPETLAPCRVGHVNTPLACITHTPARGGEPSTLTRLTTKDDPS